MDVIAIDTVAPDPGVRAEFVGDPDQFFRMVLSGILLLLPTLGFYRFWLISDIRRHLWAHTRLAGDAFEYTGRARELLIGFLMALAILTPLYVCYSIIIMEVAQWKAFAGVLLAIVVYVLAQYGSYRARRYRATRTMFRGIRFWITGSGWSYAWRAGLWDFLTLVSLGLALPWRAAVLERYKMRHTHFGELTGSFAGTGWGFFKRGWWLWLAAGFGLLAGLGIPVLVAVGIELLGRAAEKPNGYMIAIFFIGISLVPVVVAFAALALVYPVFRSIETRWRLEGLRIGEATMAVGLNLFSFCGCYIKALLFTLLLLMAVGTVFYVVQDNLLDISWADLLQGIPPSPSAIISIVSAYVVVGLGFKLIALQFMTRDLWEVTVDSITVGELPMFEGIAARGAAVGSLGEGLGDALDFGNAGGI